MDDHTYTTDLSIIDLNDNHLVLDCGPINKELPAYSTAYTVEKMSLWIAAGFAVPIRMELSTRSRITGTLYRVTKEQLIYLDKRKQNGIWFDRERVPALHKTDGQLWVWFYVGRNEYWEERIRFDQQFQNGHRTFKPAPRFQDNERMFHLAAAYDKQRIEDYDPPSQPLNISPELMASMRAMVRSKNDAEIKRLNDDIVQQELNTKKVERAAFIKQLPWYKKIVTRE